MTVYCLVDEHYRPLTVVCPIRHGGFVSQSSAVEVLDHGHMRRIFQAALRYEALRLFPDALSLFLLRLHGSHALCAEAANLVHSGHWIMD